MEKKTKRNIIKMVVKGVNALGTDMIFGAAASLALTVIGPKNKVIKVIDFIAMSLAAGVMATVVTEKTNGVVDSSMDAWFGIIDGVSDLKDLIATINTNKEDEEETED